MNNKFIKIMLYIVIFSMLILSLTGCDKSKDNKELQEKIDAELSYLDTKIVAILNKLNGISYENYIVKADEISTKSQNEESSSSSQGSNSSQSSSKEKSSEEGGESSSSSEGASSGSSSSEQDSKKESKTSVKYSMEGNEILLHDRTPDWNTVKAEIEKLYSSWSTVMLDLYKVNINNQDILSFNTALDDATR